MTKSVTIVFPGQGAQYVGMGKKLDQSYLERADKILNLVDPLSTMMNDGPQELLIQTQHTQPAIVTHSVALFDKVKKVLDEKGVSIDRVLGHSVGEYSALCCAGAISFEDAVRAVNLRGHAMQEAVPYGKGAMYAIMKVPEEKIIEACNEASNGEEKVMPANYNEPNQIVISGHTGACKRAVEWLEKNIEGRFRAVELAVSAPFHSSLMIPAGKRMEIVFDEMKFKPLQYPYIANVDAKEYGVDSDEKSIKERLIKQIDGSVRWTQSFSQLASDTVCLEVGPGRVLTGLARKINPDIKCLSMDKEGAFEELEELLR